VMDCLREWGKCTLQEHGFAKEIGFQFVGMVCCLWEWFPVCGNGFLFVGMVYCLCE